MDILAANDRGEAPLIAAVAARHRSVRVGVELDEGKGQGASHRELMLVQSRHGGGVVYRGGGAVGPGGGPGAGSSQRGSPELAHVQAPGPCRVRERKEAKDRQARS